MPPRYSSEFLLLLIFAPFFWGGGWDGVGWCCLLFVFIAARLKLALDLTFCFWKWSLFTLKCRYRTSKVHANGSMSRLVGMFHWKKGLHGMSAAGCWHWVNAAFTGSWCCWIQCSKRKINIPDYSKEGFVAEHNFIDFWSSFSIVLPHLYFFLCCITIE